MTLLQLMNAAQQLCEEGKGDLPVVCVSSSSGAADEASSLHISDHFGDEGPFDLSSHRCDGIEDGCHCVGCGCKHGHEDGAPMELRVEVGKSKGSEASVKLQQTQGVYGCDETMGGHQWCVQ